VAELRRHVDHRATGRRRLTFLFSATPAFAGCPLGGAGLR
jgi:hypothetical protein